MAIPAYHKSHMHSEDVGMLMIDSLSSFYWSDRWTAEQFEKASQTPADLPPVEDASVPAAPQPQQLRSETNPIRHVLTVVLQLRRSLGMVTFFTNWGLTTLESQLPSSVMYFRQHLRAPYPSPFDSEPARSKFPLIHHITLPSQVLPPFNPGTSLEDVTGDLGREQLLSRPKLRALVRTIAKRPGEAQSVAESKFEFAIAEDGVFVSWRW
jgi:DNA-repair protein XRCC2